MAARGDSDHGGAMTDAPTPPDGPPHDGPPHDGRASGSQTPGGPAFTGAASGSTLTAEGPRVTREEVRDLGRLRRTTGSERTIAGVAGGLGRHLDIDPVIIKVAFVVLAFFGGAGLILYGAGWLLVPDDSSDSAPFGLDERNRGIALVVIGAIAALAVLGDTLGDGLVPLPVVILIGIVLLVIMQVGKRRDRSGPASSPPPTTPPAAGSSYVSTVAETAPLQPLQTPYAAGSPYAAPPITPTSGWSAGAGWTPPPAPPVRRKPGPILFWFTAALCAFAVGALGTLDLAGLGVPSPAYPAVVVVITGSMLVLGAFWGRPGGLILLGLVSSLALAGWVTADAFDGDSTTVRPATAAEVRSSYTLDTGELILDLSDVSDPQALAGRIIEFDGEAGRLEVIVPPDLAVDARADIDGPGGFDLFGSQGGGIDITGSGSTVSDANPLVIDASLEVGFVEVLIDGSNR